MDTGSFVAASFADSGMLAVPSEQVGAEDRMPMPPARGSVSAAVAGALLDGAANDLVHQVKSSISIPVSPTDFLDDDDAQLALTLLYELHLRGIADVDDRLQWDPQVVAATAYLESFLDAAVADLVGPVAQSDVTAAASVVAALQRMTADDDSEGVSVRVRDRATADEVTELLIHRSLYQLREADLHTFGIPRISGRPKAALIEVQADEYGGGNAARMHSTLFADTMSEFGLDTRYMHYLPVVPAITLAALNVLSRYGLHRSHIGELIGHLAAIEMTSSLPSARYVKGLNRIGASEQAQLFYAEHVEADAVHEQIVLRDLVTGWVADDSARGAAVLRGAAAFLALEGRIGDHLVDSWSAGESSLRSV